MSKQLCQLFSLGIILTISGCSPELPLNSISTTNTSRHLPQALINKSLNLSEILAIRETITTDQLIAALSQLLHQTDWFGNERKEAAYILARALQSTNNPADAWAALSYFDIAKDLPALHTLSEWHASEAAYTCGKEKIVRQQLETIMAENNSPDFEAKAQYSLAQSYFRTHKFDKAKELFNTVKKEFPKSEYASGANYYLGEISFKESALKQGVAYFNDYLSVSPTGHFSSIILDRLKPLIKSQPALFSTTNFNTYGQTAYAQEHWQEAISFWNMDHIKSPKIEIAFCLANLSHTDQASTALIAALKQNPNDYRYVQVAQEICHHQNHSDSLKLWQEILAAKPQNNDAVLWNIAARSSNPIALSSYKQILTQHPLSPYAAEAQWWLFWNQVQHKKNLADLVRLADLSAQKYRTSHAAPRFLYWAGKLSEQLPNSKQAEVYYQKTADSFPSDYYAYRALAQIAKLHKSISPYAFDNRLSITSNSINWHYPDPLSLHEHIATVSPETFWELVRLKEYQEALPLAPEQGAELSAWLNSQLHEPAQAIVIASSNLVSKPNLAPIWQYAYPLLYTQLIQKNCQTWLNVDAYLMHALVREESHYNPTAVSETHAIGLTQVMPSTAYGVAQHLGMSVKNSKKFFQPAFNLTLGTEYLSYLLNQFNDLILPSVASYNGGASSVNVWLKYPNANDPDFFVENIPYKETREYVRKVFQSYWTYYNIYKQY